MVRCLARGCGRAVLTPHRIYCRRCREQKRSADPTVRCRCKCNCGLRVPKADRVIHGVQQCDRCQTGKTPHCGPRTRVYAPGQPHDLPAAIIEAMLRRGDAARRARRWTA